MQKQFRWVAHSYKAASSPAKSRTPIVSTSANISGEAAPAFYREIDERVKAGVDYVVSYRQDDETPRDPSAIIKWNADGPPTVIRP